MSCEQEISRSANPYSTQRGDAMNVNHLREGVHEMTTVEADDRELKAKHRALWASGDYPAVAAELIPAFGPELVRACGVKSGDRVLDIAAGSGNAAIPAAETGAIVTASDLTPELFAAGRRIAAARGVELEWAEADAEALPFADDSYDVVMSSAPPPPPGASPAPLWGDEDHVRELLGDRVTDLELRRQKVLIDHSATPEEFREYWKRNYGPTIAAYRFNAED